MAPRIRQVRPVDSTNRQAEKTTVWLDRRVADLLRGLGRNEHMVLSELLEAALVSWMRHERRGKYDLTFEDGTETGEPAGGIFAGTGGPWVPAPGPAVMVPLLTPVERRVTERRDPADPRAAKVKAGKVDRRHAPRRKR
jgi:hypothetical protein